MPTNALRVAIVGDPLDVHLRRWCAGLAARAVRVTCVCGKPPATPVPGIEYWILNDGSGKGRALGRAAIRWRRRLRELCTGFDIVHIHNLHHWGFDADVLGPAKLIVSTYGTDVVPTHEDQDGEPRATARHDHVTKSKQAVLRLANRVTATSRFLARATAAYAGLPEDRVEVIHFGVDTDAFVPATPERTSHGSVGFVGGFRRCKGASLLIEAIPLVLRRIPSARFTLAGTGDDLEPCGARVRELGLEPSVAFTGCVPHEQMPQLMDTFDVLAVSTTTGEAYCVAAVEAQAMHVPVVAAGVGGLPETVLHGTTGLLVEPGSPEALAEGLCYLLNSEATRRALGRAGREWVIRQHHWSDCLDRMMSAYQRVVATDITAARRARQCAAPAVSD